MLIWKTAIPITNLNITAIILRAYAENLIKFWRYIFLIDVITDITLSQWWNIWRNNTLNLA
jgi:hypothetical protein